MRTEGQCPDRQLGFGYWMLRQHPANALASKIRAHKKTFHFANIMFQGSQCGAARGVALRHRKKKPSAWPDVETGQARQL